MKRLGNNQNECAGEAGESLRDEECNYDMWIYCRSTCHRIAAMEYKVWVSDSCLRGQCSLGNNSSMRESLPSWKGSSKALRGRQIVALAVCERQNGPYSKPTSLLDSLSPLLNRESFQDLNWGGWGWVMVYGILRFSAAPVKSPVTISSFEKRQNGICRDKYGVASH